MKIYINLSSAVKCLQIMQKLFTIDKKKYKSCVLYSYRKNNLTLGQWKYICFFFYSQLYKGKFLPLSFSSNSVVQQIYYQISSKSKTIIRKDYKEFFNNFIY